MKKYEAPQLFVDEYAEDTMIASGGEGTLNGVAAKTLTAAPTSCSSGDTGNKDFVKTCGRKDDPRIKCYKPCYCK